MVRVQIAQHRYRYECRYCRTVISNKSKSDDSAVGVQAVGEDTAVGGEKS